MAKVINISVYYRGENNQSLHWEYDNACYHINLNSRDDGYIVYKNSKANHGQPGYFNTRRLDGNKTINRMMIDIAKGHMIRNSLLEKAKAKYEAQEHADDLARTEMIAKRRRVKQLLLDMKNAADNDNPWFLTATSVRELIECCGDELINNEFL